MSWLRALLERLRMSAWRVMIDSQIQQAEMFERWHERAQRRSRALELRTTRQRRGKTAP